MYIITKSSVKGMIFITPVIVKYMENNLMKHNETSLSRTYFSNPLALYYNYQGSTELTFSSESSSIGCMKGLFIAFNTSWITYSLV